MSATHFDLRTAAVLAAIISITFSGLLLVVGRQFTEGLRHASQVWIDGLIMYALAFGIVGAGKTLPAFVSPIIANGLLVLSFIPFAAALYSVFGLPLRRMTVVGVAAAAFCMVENAWFHLSGDAVNVRLSLGTACQGVVTFSVLALLWKVPRREQSFGLHTALAAFAFYATTLVYRVGMLQFGVPMATIFDRPIAQYASYLSAVLLPLVSSVGFLQLCFQKKLEESKRLSENDYLTGSLTRQALHERADEAIAEAGRTGEVVSVVLFDLDGLKTTNDEFGHKAGDAALIALTAAISVSLREGDLFGRIGGDEFVVLLRGASASEASDFQKGIKRRLELSNRMRAVSVRTSAGCATLSAEADTFGILLERADAEMYADKRLGEVVAARVQLAT